MKSSIDARSTSFEQNDATSRLVLVLFLEVDWIKERTTSGEFTIVNPYLDSRIYLCICTVLARVPCICIIHVCIKRTVRSMISFHPSESPYFCILFNHPSLRDYHALSFAIRGRKAYPSETPLSVRQYEFIEANDGDVENRERPTRPYSFLSTEDGFGGKSCSSYDIFIAKTFSIFNSCQLRAFYPEFRKIYRRFHTRVLHFLKR